MAWFVIIGIIIACIVCAVIGLRALFELFSIFVDACADD